MKRKLWLTLALAALMAALVCGAALADNDSGTCGIGLTWQFSSGKLTISGTGDMGDYTDYESTMPWRDIHDQITSVEIGSGVTSIGNNAFFNGSSRKVRETNRKEPDERKEEEVVTVPIS